MTATLSTTQYVGSGSGNSGSDNGTTINSGGVQYVGFDFGTGTATSATINAGGSQFVGLSGGTGYATNTTLLSGIQAVGEFYGTGHATGTTISAGSQYVGVYLGAGSAVSTTIDTFGIQYVGYDSGTGYATSTTIDKAGTQIAGLSGGTGHAISTTINDLGLQLVGEAFGTGYAADTTINSGGGQFVGETSGTGYATGTTINNGGGQYIGVYAGGVGTATDTSINAGGTQYVGYDDGSGTASSTTINSGGFQYVGQTLGVGTVLSTVISSGGSQFVGYSRTFISGSGSSAVYANNTGYATGTMIESGGSQEVGEFFGTGYATDTTISGGMQYLGFYFGTGYAASTTINAGTQFVGVFGSGYATDTTLNAGLQLIGGAGGVGTVASTTINTGTQIVGDAGGIGTAISTTLNAGTQFVGAAAGSSSAGSYSAGTGYATGTVINGGTQFVGASAGSNYSAGTGYATATVINGGEQIVDMGGTAVDTVIHSSGLADILAGGTADMPVIDGGTLKLESGASITAGPVAFATTGSGGTLDLTSLGTGVTFATAVSGFNSAHSGSDMIAVAGTGAAGDHVVWTQTGTSGTLQVETASGTMLETLTLDGTYAQQGFVLTDPVSVDQITYTICLVAGTRIRTPRGETPVEALRPGDQVSTASGPARVRWVGRRAYDGRFLAGNHLALPVTIHAGALGVGVPVRDLSVSPGHGLWLESALVPAWRLVNGISITQAAAVERVEYFNIELEEHALLFAHGAKVESFLDDGVFRNQFQNASEYWQLYPDAPLCRDVTPLPRLESGFALADIMARVNRRAGITPAITAPGPLRGFVDIVGADGWIYGWAQDEAMPEAPVALRLYAQGRYLARTLANIYRPDLRVAAVGSGCHGFACRIPANCAAAVEVRREDDEAVLPWTDRLRESAA